MIYKLKYESREHAEQDLKAKGVIDNAEAIVWVGLIMDTPPVFDGLELITEATYLDGYHVDVMIDQVIEFSNALNPSNPKHIFAGW